jgi:hypothetical protein
MNNIVIDKVAYEFEEKGYKFRATYLKEPKGDALIEIFKEDKLIKEFLFPSYKIYNISAHVNDIINDLEEGLKIAGSNGLGSNSYQG